MNTTLMSMACDDSTLAIIAILSFLGVLFIIYSIRNFVYTTLDILRGKLTRN